MSGSGRLPLRFAIHVVGLASLLSGQSGCDKSPEVHPSEVRELPSDDNLERLHPSVLKIYTDLQRGTLAGSQASAYGEGLNHADKKPKDKQSRLNRYDFILEHGKKAEEGTLMMVVVVHTPTGRIVRSIVDRACD